MYTVYQRTTNANDDDDDEDQILKTKTKIKTTDSTTSVTRPCLTTQHRTCKTKTKTKADFFVSDRSCPKTDGLRPHH